jgi:hypothetical protein
MIETKDDGKVAEAIELVLERIVLDLKTFVLFDINIIDSVG